MDEIAAYTGNMTQIATLAALLGGFSFSVYTRFTEKGSDNAETMVFLSALAATVCFLVSVFNCTMMAIGTSTLSRIEGGPTSVEELPWFLHGMVALGSLSFFGGVLLLLVCIGLSGFLRSRGSGTATLLAALGGGALTLGVFVIASLLMPGG